MSLYGPFNLASGIYVAVPLLISNCSASWNQEVMEPGVWPIRNDKETSVPRYPTGPCLASALELCAYLVFVTFLWGSITPASQIREWESVSSRAEV